MMPPFDHRPTSPTPAQRRAFAIAVPPLFCMALLLALPGPVTAALQRPANIKFGMYHNMADAVLRFDGTQMYVGAKAAEKEINDGNVLNGITLTVDYVPAATLASSSAVITGTARNFTEDPQFFGAILTDWGSSTSLSNVGRQLHNGTYPIIGSRHLSNNAFLNDSRSELSLRQPPSTEFLMMLHHAMNSEESRCTSFAVVTRTFFNTTLVAPTLAKFGFTTLPLDLGANFFALPNATQVLDQWYAGSSTTGFYPPQCGLFFTTADDARHLLQALYNDSRFDSARMTFYAAGLTSEGMWNSSFAGTAPFARMHFVTNFPDVHSTTKPVSIRFRQALSNYLATVNMADVPAAMKQVPFMTTPSLPAMEGYLAMRWIAEIMSMMPSINRTLFIDNIYTRRFFWLNDLTVGPLSDRCLVDSETDLTCFCNVAMTVLHILRIDEETGFPTADDSDPSLRQLTFPLSECFLTPENLRTPIAFEMWYPQGSSAAGISVFNDFTTMMGVLSRNYNNALTTRTAMFSATLMNDLVPFLSGETKDQYLRRVYVQRRPTIVFSDFWTEVTVPVINTIAAPYTLYEDAPLTTPTQHSRFSWMLKPTLADLAHGIAMYLQQMYTAGGEKEGRTPKVSVLSDTAEGLSVATRSVHTVQWPVSGGGVVDLTDSATMRQAIRAAMATAASGQDVVLLLSTLSSPIAVDAIAAAAEISQTYEGTSAAVHVWDHFVLAIATDQNNLYRAKFALANTSSLPFFPILFGSYMYAFWEPTNSQRLRAMTLLNTASSAVVESIAYHAGLMMFAMFSEAVANLNMQYPTATDILDYLYKQGQVTANGVAIGPIYDANCSASVIAANEVNRHCQCFKILRTVNVHDFRDWLQNTADHNPSFRWSMPYCGVAYSPLIEPTTLNIAMIAGIAAPCGAAALAAAFYFACCFGRRSNRTAPKNPNEPFAMAFTDIQSSTSLWARAPEQMGAALEKHHELLRRLVSRYDGYEVKTIGDSFMVAFKRAQDAAAFALAIQTTLFSAEWDPEIDDVYVALAQEAHEDALMNEDPKKAAERRAKEGVVVHQWEDELNYPLNWNGIRVRVGLHWGVGSVKFDPVSQGYDYYGTLVNTAARVEGVGNGGQVLATKDLYAQLEEEGFNFADVDLKPLGPQPLRGLDQPVPLFQLCPMALRGREFAALRLDIENDVDDSTTDATTTRGDDSHTHSSIPLDESPELLMARLLKRQKDSGPLMEYLQRVVHFVETLLRTSPMSWRKETVKAMMKKWHVHARKPREREAAELTLAYDLTALVARVGLAAEEARKVAHTSKGGDTVTDANSSIAAKSRMVARKRSSVSMRSTTRVEDL